MEETNSASCSRRWRLRLDTEAVVEPSCLMEAREIGRLRVRVLGGGRGRGEEWFASEKVKF